MVERKRSSGRDLEGETVAWVPSSKKKIEILFLILFLILGLRKSDFSAVGLRRRQLWGSLDEEGAVIG